MISKQSVGSHLTMILVLVPVLVMAKFPCSIFPSQCWLACSWCTVQLGLALGHGTNTSALSSLPRPPHTPPWSPGGGSRGRGTHLAHSRGGHHPPVSQTSGHQGTGSYRGGRQVALQVSPQSSLFSSAVFSRNQLYNCTKFRGKKLFQQ